MGVGDCFLVSLALTASMMLITGVFLPGWSEEAVLRLNKGVVINYIGFWETCDYRAGVLQVTDQYDFMRAVEVLISVGSFLLFFACLTFASYECFMSPTRRRKVRIVMGVATMAAALFIIPGATIFAVKIQTGFDLCLWMTFVAAVLAFISGILAFLSRSVPGEAP